MLPAGKSPVIRGQRVVVLDSNPVLVSITGALRMAGYCVFQAYNGQAAEELCRTLPNIGLLVLNTHVDGMDGNRLFSAARANRADLPILHIDTHRGPSIPADIPTLTQPFTSEQLLACVEDALATSTSVRPDATPRGRHKPVLVPDLG